MKKNRILSVILSFAMILGLMPVMAMPALATEGDDVPAYAAISWRLESAQTVYASDAATLKNYLNNPIFSYNIVLTADISEVNHGYYGVWCTINQAKSLDLNGHYIYVTNDKPAESTMFAVSGDALLELNDSAGGGYIHYDGYIHKKGAAQRRHIFDVAGTMIMNGGTIEAGRSKKGEAKEKHTRGYVGDKQVWKQVIGCGVRVLGGTFIMNGGTVYGRGLGHSMSDIAAVYTDSGSHAFINGGVAGCFGGGCVFRYPNYSLISNGGEDPSLKGLINRGGYYFTTSSYYFARSDDQFIYYDWQVDSKNKDKDGPYGCIGYIGGGNRGRNCSRSNGSLYARSVYCNGIDTVEPKEIQNLKTTSPYISVEPEYYYTELKGVYTHGLIDGLLGHRNELSYEWQVYDGSRWLISDDHTNPVNVMTAWESKGFVPVEGQSYLMRCVAQEIHGSLSYSTVYQALPFVVNAPPQPVIQTDLPSEITYYNGDTIELEVDATGDNLIYHFFTDDKDDPGNYMNLQYDGGNKYTIVGAGKWCDGMTVHCTVINDENQWVTSNTCTLVMDGGEIPQIEFTTDEYERTGVPFVPTDGKPMPTKVNCKTKGITVERVRWVDGLFNEFTAPYTGQRLSMEIQYRFAPGTWPAEPDAEQFNVTLDGQPFEGWKNFSNRKTGVVGTHYWNMTAVPQKDSYGNDIESYVNKAELAVRGSIAPGFPVTDVIEEDCGFNSIRVGEGDVRYSIVSTMWECDDKPIDIEDTYLAYANHKVTVTLRAADGWAFSPASVIMLDNEKCKVEMCTGNTIIVSHSFYVVDEEDEADFENFDVIVDDYAKLSTENTSDVIDDGGSFSFEIEDNGGEPELQSIGLMSLSREARLFAEPEELPAGTHDDGSIFGSIYLNEDFTSANTIIKNNEKGLVIYVAKDVTLTNTAGKPCLELNGHTTITGPGRLTLVTSNEGTRQTGPAAIQVNGAKLKIENAALEVRGCKGIQGKSVDGNDAELSIDYSNVKAVTALGGIYGFEGGMTLTDSAVTTPERHLGSTTGIYRQDSGHLPFENVTIVPRREVQSVTIGGLRPGETSLTMNGGETRQLTATVLPSDAAVQEVTWSASNNNVKVSSDGTVTAYKVGNSVVTASCGGKTASIGVAVTSNDVDVESIGIIPTEITVGVGRTTALFAQLLPLNASDLSGFWYSDDTSVATVNTSGNIADVTASPMLVTGVAPGDASIILFSNGYADAIDCTVHVVDNFVPASGVTIAGESSRTLRFDTTANLTATVTPQNATDKTVIWQSSDPEIVSVDQSGQITANGEGDARITAGIWDGTQMVESYVDIHVPSAVWGVGISEPRSIVYEGNSVQLEAFVYPGNAENTSVIWSSDNPSVASVDANGLVTGVSVDGTGPVSGSATITATTADGGFTDSVTISVEHPPVRVNEVQLSQYELTLPENGSKRIYVTLTPDNADNIFWTWETSDSSVATVENVTQEYGVVTANGTGTATIRFISEDGNRTAKLTVNVLSTQDYVPVTGVAMEDITIGVGQSISLKPTVTPANASNRTVIAEANIYSCVEAEGEWITGIEEGFDIINVTVGEQTAHVNVNVVKPVESLELDEQSLELEIGETATLTATALPANAYDRTVTWESDNDSIVTVDAGGNLTAVGFGTTYITAKTEAFPLEATCTVTVVNNEYDLYVNGTQVTDENCSDITGTGTFAYTSSTKTLTISGNYGVSSLAPSLFALRSISTDSGKTPLIKSDIDGLNVVIAANSTLSNEYGIFDVSDDTTVTGAKLTVESTNAAPISVSGGATLTLSDIDVNISGPVGITGYENGESLVVTDSHISFSDAVGSVSGFDGGITLSGCRVMGGGTVQDGAIVNENGYAASSVVIGTTVYTGSMTAYDGREITYTLDLDNGDITVSGNGYVSTSEPVLVGAYDSDGKLIDIHFVNSENTATAIDATGAEIIKIMWWKKGNMQPNCENAVIDLK